MSVQESSNNSTVPFIRSGTTFVREAATIIQDAARTITLAFATLMAKMTMSLPTTGTADAGNTGNGTVTGVARAAGVAPREGEWELECTAAGVSGVKAGTVTAGGGNTGDGTVTGLAISSGDTPKIGSYALTCTDKEEGGTTTGTAAFVGTGNGTASAVVTGAETIEGLYLLTCVDATVSGSEIFEVSDPNGVTLESLTVGVAYLNAHIGITLTDGATDFVAGDVWTLTMVTVHGGTFKLEDPDGTLLANDLALPGTAGGTLAVEAGGIEFTITDGATDFEVADIFAITVLVADGGTFKLTDPGGNIVKNDIVMVNGAGQATTYYINEAGMTFIITDGSTDFASGDLFVIEVTAVDKWTEFDEDAVDGSQIPAGIFLGSDILAATIVSGDVTDNPILVGGCCTIDENQLVIEGTATLDSVLASGKTIRDTLYEVGIFAEDTVDIDGYENT